MDLAAAFSEIGLGFSSLFGGPYHDARTIEQVAPVYDDGGSIIAPGSVQYRTCQAQIDTATQRMREADGYVDTDVAFIVLADTLDGALGTEARIEILAGPHVGKWSVELIERDTVAAGWVGRGRRDGTNSTPPPDTNGLTYSGEPLTYGGEPLTYGA